MNFYKHGISIIKKIIEKYRNLSLPIKASLAFFFCSVLQRGISVLTTPIFTRLLTTEQYGYYTIFNSWLEIISVFTTLKLAGSVFQQALVKFDKQRDELSASAAGLGTTISVLVYCIYMPLRQYINNLLEMNTFIITCIFVASWATLMFELWADRQRNEYNYKPLVLLTIFTSIAKPLLGVLAVCATIEYKAEARIVSLVAVEVIAYTWLFVSFMRNGNFYNKKIWKYFLLLNIPLVPHYLTRMILNQSDRLMIKSMVGLSEAGIYGLAHSLAWMLTLVTTAILNTMNPWIFQRIKTKEYNIIGKSSYSILIIVAVAGGGLISVAPEIVKIFAPEDYYAAIWVIPPLVISVFFQFMYSLFACFEYYFEKTRYLMIASIFGGVLNIILNYLFIKMFGFIAAGYTTLLCYIFYVFIHYIFMRKIQKENLDDVKVYNPIIIFAISCIFVLVSTILMMAYNLSIVRYIIIAVTLGATYIEREKIIATIKAVKS